MTIASTRHLPHFGLLTFAVRYSAACLIALTYFASWTLAQGLPPGSQVISEAEGKDGVKVVVYRCYNRFFKKVCYRDCDENGQWPPKCITTCSSQEITEAEAGNVNHNGSLIDNLSANHHHLASDYSSRGGGAAGCGSCGGAAVASPLGNLNIQRRHRLRDITQTIASFGPGVFSNLDLTVRAYKVADGAVVDLFDPQDVFPHRLVDGIEGDVADGVFTNGRSLSVKELRIYDAQGAATTDLDQAVTAVLSSWDGAKFHFRLMEMGGDSRVTNGLVARWRMDEATGLTVSDSIGSDDGTISGSVAWNDVERTPALEFTGGVGRVDFPARDFGDEFTLSLWVRPDTNSNIKCLVSNRATGSTTDGFTLLFNRYQTNDRQIVLSTGNGSSNATARSSTAAITQRHWNHVAVTVDRAAATARIYLNGIDITEDETIRDDFKINSAWLIASYANNQFRYDGQYDDLSLYDRVLTADEVRILAQRGTDLLGRFEKYVDRNDYQLTVTYKSFTPTEIQDSPERQFQIDTVTDPHGRQLTFSYKAQQVSGHWVVEKVDLPADGQAARAIEYFYEDDAHLTRVELPDGTESSIAYSVDFDTQATVVDYFEAAADATHRKKRVYLTNNFVETQETEEIDDTIWNQASLLMRMLVNGDSEVAYLNVSTEEAAAANSMVIYEGGGKLRFAHSRLSRYYEAGWNWDLSQGYAGLSGTLEDTYSEIPYTNKPDNLRATYPSVQDRHGRVFDYVYDSNGYRTKKTYADNTTETWQYNSFKQVTRYEDRLNRVTKYQYDARGNRTLQQTGILNTGTDATPNDVNQAEFAELEWEYYPAAHANQFLLRYAFDANDNRTEYIYNTDQLLVQINEPDDTGAGYHAASTFTYDAANRLQTTADALGRTTQYFYDARDRVIQVQYDDDSTERTAYGAAGSGRENLIVATQDRNGVVTSLDYDDSGRLVKRITASHQVPQVDVVDNTKTDLSALLAGNEITDPNIRVEYTCTYLPGTNVRNECVNAGEKTTYAYDYRHRPVESTRHVRSGKSLTSTSAYQDNLLFSSEDPYGRKSFNAYRTSDSALIRSVQATLPGPTGEPTTFAQVLALNRVADPAPNAEYLISDYLLDAEGQTTETVDPRGISHTTDYDSRGRATTRTEASGTAVAAQSETIYDAQSNVVEVRTPRYFDAGDPQTGNVRTTMTYTRRNLLASKTAAPSTTVSATETYTYNLDGTRDTTTDGRGNDWQTLWGVCCRRAVASVAPLAEVDGSGTDKHSVSITNYDHYGDVTHTAVVQAATVPAPQSGDCCGANSFYNDPPDADTLNEVTTRFDARHRAIARTVWLVPRGNLDPNDVPIAGGGAGGDPNVDVGGVTQGLTTRWFYDEDLTDSSGLEAGITVPFIRGGGSFTLDISDLLTELTADGTSADSAVADFSATAVVNPEDEISVTIQDGAGRTVASAVLEQNGDLITWNTAQHDAVVALPGFGDVLETASVDALDHVTKSRTDGAGRTLQTEDAEQEVSSATYDGNSNMLSSRDPNNVGQDCVYDARNRDTTCTDTQGDTVATEYDANSNVVVATDAKSNDVTFTYDARDRRSTSTDRIGAVTTSSYDENSNLVSLEDGELQETVYEYDPRNLKVKTTWPDHVAGQNPGDANYGITECRYDAAGRTTFCTDQLGDTVTRNYDLANRVITCDYRTLANSPNGTISDTETFEYDDDSRLVEAVSGRYTNTVMLSYDNAGRLLDESLSVNFGTARTYTATSSYDEANRRTTLTYPDGTIVDRTFTARDQLASVLYTNTVVGGSLNQATVDSRTYDDGMRLDTQTAGNGIVTSRTYRDDDLTSTITRTGLSGANFAYDYDANKNKLQETINAPMAAYGFNSATDAVYDDEDRLTEWNRDDTNRDLQWNLSLVGDWNTFTVEGVPESRTHGDAHEITTVGANPLTHDAKGNLTGHSNTQSYAWDFDNQLDTATVPGTAPGVQGTHGYSYDALGRRVSKTVNDSVAMTTVTTVFVYSGQQTIAEYAANATAATSDRKYLYASYIDERCVMVDRTVLGASAAGTEELFYYHANHLYSVAALTDTAANVVERYAYDAYGNVTYLDAAGAVLGTQASIVGQPYLFTGRRLDDETATYHYRARYYDATLGRFLGRDPVSYDAGNNTYAYTSNRSVSYVDPYGLTELKPGVMDPQADTLLGRSVTQGERRVFNKYGPNPVPNATDPIVESTSCPCVPISIELKTKGTSGEYDLAGHKYDRRGHMYMYRYKKSFELGRLKKGTRHPWAGVSVHAAISFEVVATVKGDPYKCRFDQWLKGHVAHYDVRVMGRTQGTIDTRGDWLHDFSHPGRLVKNLCVVENGENPGERRIRCWDAPFAERGYLSALFVDRQSYSFEAMWLLYPRDLGAKPVTRTHRFHYHSWTWPTEKASRVDGWRHSIPISP